MKIVWNDDTFVGFDGEPREIPPEAVGMNATVAAVIMNGEQKLDKPVWLFPHAARDLQDAHILRREETILSYFGEFEVYLYAATITVAMSWS